MIGVLNFDTYHVLKISSDLDIKTNKRVVNGTYSEPF